MNAVEIEEAVSVLALAPFRRAEFPFALLAAFGNKDTTVQRLRTGNTNQSDVPGGLLQRNQIHMATCDQGRVGDTLAALKASPRNSKAKPKFVLATDGVDFEAKGLATGAIEAGRLQELGDKFGFFLPLASISTVAEIKNNPIDIRATSRLNKLYVELLREKPLFVKVQNDLDAGIPEARRFGKEASIDPGEFFILGGQMVYVAHAGDEERHAKRDVLDRRLRVIHDNGTESAILMRSLQRALHKDETGRRITDPDAGPLFGNAATSEDTESGTIYILRSLSQHPAIASHRQVIHKIGVTGGDVGVCISKAGADPTYLFADVEVVATYQLFNINRSKLEILLHRFFAPARVDVDIPDRFGRPVRPREWFLVPLPVIDEVVEKVHDQSILQYSYDPRSARLQRVPI